MTTPRPGDLFRLDLDGMIITGHYIEVDPPRRMLVGWDRQGTENATATPALIEFTFTPTGDETTVEVQLSGLSAEDADLYPPHLERYLDQIKAAFAGSAPARTAPGMRNDQ